MLNTSAGKPRVKPLRDFRSYGRIEAFNALLVPGLAIYYGWPRDAPGAAALALANLAVVIGLIVGAIYWLALAERIAGNAAPMRRALTIAHLAQLPMLVVTVVAAMASAALVATRGLNPSTAITAGIALLAALEYINYYHVQLQHFDNLADWRKLTRGRGFRKAHMARDLATWRRRRA